MAIIRIYFSHNCISYKLKVSQQKLMRIKWDASFSLCLYYEEENAGLQESNRNQIEEIQRLERELDQFKKLDNHLKKERQKTKEQEKVLQRLEEELTSTRAELDKIQVMAEAQLLENMFHRADLGWSLLF